MLRALSAFAIGAFANADSALSTQTDDAAKSRVVNVFFRANVCLCAAGSTLAALRLLRVQGISIRSALSESDLCCSSPCAGWASILKPIWAPCSVSRGLHSDRRFRRLLKIYLLSRGNIETVAPIEVMAIGKTSDKDTSSHGQVISSS